MFNYDHPSIWEFIDGLKRDNAYNRMLLAQMAAAAPPPGTLTLDYKHWLECINYPKQFLFLEGYLTISLVFRHEDIY